jgi:uncharacterized protein
VISRREFITAGSAAIALASPAEAQVAELDFLTAGPGSGFLPYGEGVARVVNPGGQVQLKVVQTKGSIDNLAMVEASPNRIATAFNGSAYEAIEGIGPFAGRKHPNIRAIAPMYETSFQIAAKASKTIRSVRDLEGRRVGVGPAAGPAEAFFKGLMEVTGLKATIVNGTSAELEAAYLADTIDAFWQGASVPIPALVRMANATDSVVFGLSDQDVAAMLARFPYLAQGDVAANAYRGQSTILKSVAAWNVIICHASLPEEVAFKLTEAILDADKVGAATNGQGAGTTISNARHNKVVPWHPGAARFLRTRGVVL